MSQLVGTARVRVKRVAAGGTHRSGGGTWPTPVHLTCARRVVDPTYPRTLAGEHARRECRGRGALLSPLPVPSARGDERRGTIQPPTLSTPPSMHSALSRPYPFLLSSTHRTPSPSSAALPRTTPSQAFAAHPTAMLFLCGAADLHARRHVNRPPSPPPCQLATASRAPTPPFALAPGWPRGLRRLLGLPVALGGGEVEVEGEVASASAPLCSPCAHRCRARAPRPSSRASVPRAHTPTPRG